MLQVEQIDYIRLETNQKGCTYSDVANRMRIDARTVKKYADQEDLKQRETVERPSPVMDPVKPIIDKWIKVTLSY
ncbi:hypothetical protein MUO14_08270 [Halobacillus shinanisalinarum]|uniref:Transposase n=1 Tax=Halobacillus shinanisalinarum TaxID=2932258 RepID=A0ABY4H5P6_9BACI|nr:hypothetical protein [Halobacillus shinanisalinarum]UOQ94907.1 hypothetical protein MUO14_08270 [Halobacillus shinanisalinarum]